GNIDTHKHIFPISSTTYRCLALSESVGDRIHAGDLLVHVSHVDRRNDFLSSGEVALDDGSYQLIPWCKPTGLDEA
ncbi:hypothetical protein FOCC_FOCC014243, partial [Frankliniella occidentalis]